MWRAETINAAAVEFLRIISTTQQRKQLKSSRGNQLNISLQLMK